MGILLSDFHLHFGTACLGPNKLVKSKPEETKETPVVDGKTMVKRQAFGKCPWLTLWLTSV